jgi:4-hydroxybenzoate polyprenyltransferase
MDHLEQFRQRLRNQMFSVVMFVNILGVGVFYLLNKYTGLPDGLTLGLALVSSVVLAAAATNIARTSRQSAL